MFLFYHYYAAKSTSVQTLFTPKSISAHAVILSEPILLVNPIPVTGTTPVPIIDTEPIPLVNCCPVTLLFVVVFLQVYQDLKS
jgi:hypothetical protein